MKKIIYTTTIALLLVALNSCKSGCGCPGGAGYSQNKNQNIIQKKVTNISLFSI